MRIVRPLLLMAMIVLCGLAALAFLVMTVTGAWIAVGTSRGAEFSASGDRRWWLWVGPTLLSLAGAAWAARRLRAERLAAEDEPTLWI